MAKFIIGLYRKHHEMLKILSSYLLSLLFTGIVTLQAQQVSHIPLHLHAQLQHSTLHNFPLLVQLAEGSSAQVLQQCGMPVIWQHGDYIRTSGTRE